MARPRFGNNFQYHTAAAVKRNIFSCLVAELSKESKAEALHHSTRIISFIQLSTYIGHVRIPNLGVIETL